MSIEGWSDRSIGNNVIHPSHPSSHHIMPLFRALHCHRVREVDTDGGDIGGGVKEGKKVTYYCCSSIDPHWR
jgi:hypothetical protein